METKSLFEQYMDSIDTTENIEPEFFDEETVKGLLQNSDFHKGRITAVSEEDSVSWLIEGNDTVLTPDRSDFCVGYIVKLKPVVNGEHKVKFTLFPKKEGTESNIAVTLEFKGTIAEIKENFNDTSYLENYVYDVVLDLN